MLQCWRWTGHLPSFCVPTRGDLTLKSPYRREFAIQGKKNANARGSARIREGGGGGVAMGAQVAQAYYESSEQHYPT